MLVHRIASAALALLKICPKQLALLAADARLAPQSGDVAVAQRATEKDFAVSNAPEKFAQCLAGIG